MSHLAALKSFMIRHRAPLGDLSLLALATSVGAYVLYTVDVFVRGHDVIRSSIEFDELPILGALLCLGMLAFSWRRSVERRRESGLRANAEREARQLALQDPLTGLPNRRRFTEALKRAVGAPPRTGGAHAVLMIDLNGFKQINDVHGHGVGDDVLCAVSKRLARHMREADLIARLGGDEFAVLAQHISGAEAATNVALRIIEALATPIRVGALFHNVGAGIGIALFPFPNASAEEVMRRADVALYKAKGTGKSALRFFDEEMDRHVREREELERELRSAILAKEVRPFFQPLVDLKTKNVVGFEALARWHHKKLGYIPPDRFIPVAEETGLISELSDQLLREACDAANNWPANVILAFNISPVQLRDPTLGLRILGILGATGFSPRRLEVEITESALVRDLEAAQQNLGALREAGVRIALDDFGTGYSSLYHLRNFKVDKIKIDRSFIARMGVEHESAQIVSALVGLGKGLGLTVIAEGIDSDSQDAALLNNGCEQGQGFLYGKAVSSEQTRQFFGALPAARLDVA